VKHSNPLDLAVKNTEKGDDKNVKTDYNVKKLKADYTPTSMDDKMLAFIYKFPDAPLRAIAAHVGLSSSGVHQRIKRPAFQKRLKDMRADVAGLLNRAKLMAIRRLMELTQSKDESIALKACLGTLQSELAGEGLAKFAEAGGQIVYAVQFGEGGQIFNSTIKIPPKSNPSEIIDAEISDAKFKPGDAPSNTLELLG